MKAVTVELPDEAFSAARRSPPEVARDMRPLRTFRPPFVTDFWISNASPLITLAAVGRLDLFAALKSEIARVTRLGLLPQAAPVISAVREAGLYVSATLVRAVLKELGEAE